MQILNETVMRQIGEWIGERLQGGELIELRGDVGAGKTTLTRGIAHGLGIAEQIQSPTFTISREYSARDGLELVHYDFYRLNEAGIMADELSEKLGNPKTVIVIEWSAVASDVLPANRTIIEIKPVAHNESAREISWTAQGRTHAILKECNHVFAA